MLFLRERITVSTKRNKSRYNYIVQHKKGRVGGMGSGGGVVLLLRVQEAEKGVQESCGEKVKRGKAVVVREVGGRCVVSLLSNGAYKPLACRIVT